MIFSSENTSPEGLECLGTQINPLIFGYLESFLFRSSRSIPDVQRFTVCIFSPRPSRVAKCRSNPGTAQRNAGSLSSFQGSSSIPKRNLPKRS